MIEKKFVFAVKLEEFENIYEVFDIFFVTEQYPDFLKRWSEGFSNNDVEVINVSSLNPTPKTFDVGSIWDGTKFIPKITINRIEVHENFISYAFLNTDKVVFGAHLIKKVDEFYIQKWQAAMTSKVIGLDATDFPEVILGYLWDGNNFYPPENN